MNSIFRGSATALVTPFKENGAVNYDKLEELIEEQILEGVDALVICGTTGEASALPDDEHVEVVRISVQASNKRVPIIAGMGSNDTMHGVRLAQSIEKVGADALLNVTPYYNKTTQKGLVKHFEITSKSSSLPVILYNVPSRTGLNINPETYYALAKVENIVAIKECNIHQVVETKKLCGDAYVHYSGEDGLVVPMLSLGAQGVISVLGNIDAKHMNQMTHAWFDENYTRALQLQVEKIDLIEALFSEVSPIPVKAAMNLMGKNVGPCRLPLCEMDKTKEAHVEDLLKKYELIS